LPGSVEVCAVQLPGRESRLREPAHQRVAPLVAELCEALGPELAAPFAFFGHSMGALVAFELTRALRRQGRPGPVLLAASGRHAPHLDSRRRPIHELPEAEFRGEIRALGGTPHAVLEHEELMGLFSPLLRADFTLLETHRHAVEPPLDLPIVAVAGWDDPWVNRDELEAWRALTTAPVAVHQLPGTHFYLQTARDELLALLSEALAAAEVAR
jgi:medium-chain acyl-[acyl-carrier-protein] hydrolase